MKKHLLLLWSVGIMLAGCKASLQSEDEKKQIENDEQIQRYVTGQKLNAQKTSTGLYYVITPGTGTRKAAARDEVAMHYKLYRLVDNVLLDSSSVSLNKPEYFPFGVGWYRIVGLEEGISLMKEGDKANLLIPAHLAFGSRAFDVLPAYSVIRMEVTFLSARNEDEQIAAYVAKNKLTVTETTSNGLRYVLTQANPTGAALTRGQIVKVNYTGALLRDNRIFKDNKYSYSPIFDSGTFEFTLGGGQVIEGFDTGIAKMKVGEKAKLIFPSALGYKNQGSGETIPPYAPLAFDIEVVSVR
jgi:FKBP-type peptidyl-prolyl cis-trans isomerase